MSSRRREAPAEFLRSILEAEGKIKPPKQPKIMPRKPMLIDRLCELERSRSGLGPVKIAEKRESEGLTGEHREHAEDGPSS